MLDIDSTLVEVHSENKAGAAGHFKGGYGFHPMLCATAEGEPLSVKLRPGNAAANSICDHLEVLDAAIAQLPEAVASGHRRGDAAAASRSVQLRADSAGCSTEIPHGCRDRNVGFSLAARSNAQVHTAIHQVRFDGGCWEPALKQNGEPDGTATVAELTSLVDLRGWPERTRLIVRREPLHPGAQRTLFESGTHRYWGHYTDSAGTPAELDTHIRAHAAIEDTIARLKDSGLNRMPFSDFDANAAWAALVLMSAALVKWFQQLCLSGPLAKAAPKRLRWQLWHAPVLRLSSPRRWC